MATNNTLAGAKFSVQALADTVTSRASKGILYLVIDDANVTPKLYTYTKLKQVTENYGEENKAFISKAFSDYGVTKVLVAVGHDAINGISGCLDTTLALLNKINFNGWMAVPQVEKETDKKKIADFIKTQRSDEDYPLKGVLGNYLANHEAIVNFTGSDLGISTNEYCLDVACVLCTLGANESITNYTAKNVTGCDIKEDTDVSIQNGELFIIYNGINYVFTNGVNSLTTIPNGQSEDITHIRVVEVIDMVKSDIYTILNGKYIGKKGNSYTNRRTLVASLDSYLQGTKDYLSNDEKSYAELDAEATRDWLEKNEIITSEWLVNHGYEDIDDVEDDVILKQKLGVNVFIKISLFVMDTMEKINIKLQYQI